MSPANHRSRDRGGVRALVCCAVLALTPLVGNAQSDDPREQLKKDKAAWERAQREAETREKIRKQREQFLKLQEQNAKRSEEVKPVEQEQSGPPPEIKKEEPRVERSKRKSPNTSGRNRVVTAAAPDRSALIKAFSLYLRGDYAAVMQELRQFEPPQAELALSAHLLRAAASHSKYALEGRREEVLLQQAVQQIQLCSSKNPRFVPDGRLFSPRFIEFYKEHADSRGPGRESDRRSQ